VEEETIVLGTNVGIIRSADGGATWQVAEQDGARGFITSITRGPGATLLAAKTGHGLIISNDHGLTWSPFAAVGLPSSQISEVKIQDGTIYIAGSQGVWIARLLNGIKREDEESDHRAFPNPFTNVLTVKNVDSGQTSMFWIVDIVGRSVYRGTSVTINTAEWPQGTYVITTSSSDKPLKVTKQ
jgi:hypothetical protein